MFPQVRPVGREEEAGLPAGERDADPAEERPDAAGRHGAQRHGALQGRGPAPETYASGLVSSLSHPSSLWRGVSTRHKRNLLVQPMPHWVIIGTGQGPAGVAQWVSADQ